MYINLLIILVESESKTPKPKNRNLPSTSTSAGIKVPPKSASKSTIVDLTSSTDEEMLDNDALPPKPKSSGKKRAANPAVSGGRSTQKEAAAAPPPRRQIIRIYIGRTPDDFQGEPRYSITAEMKDRKPCTFVRMMGLPVENRRGGPRNLLISCSMSKAWRKASNMGTSSLLILWATSRTKTPLNLAPRVRICLTLSKTLITMTSDLGIDAVWIWLRNDGMAAMMICIFRQAEHIAATAAWIEHDDHTWWSLLVIRTCEMASLSCRWHYPGQRWRYDASARKLPKKRMSTDAGGSPSKRSRSNKMSHCPFFSGLSLHRGLDLTP